MTALEGIQDYVEDDVRVMYSKGSNLFKENEESLAQNEDRISEALAVTECSDIVVLCIGLDESLEGEEGDTGNAYASGDKINLSFHKGQQKLLETVLNTDKPVIVCNFSGSAMDLSFAEEQASAILQVWYPGALGGRALAKLLFGDVSPSGKLPVTFYRSLEGLPEFEDYSMEGRTYRYMKEEPLYPFGYGLTYGKIQVEWARFENKPSRKENLKMQVYLKNYGENEVQDVLQAYIRNESRHAPRNPVLCGFLRVSLKAGEEGKVSLVIPKTAFYVINDEGEKIFDAVTSTIYVGTCAPDSRSITLTGQKPYELKIGW